MMNLLSSTIAPPKEPSKIWSIATLKQNILCGICYVQGINHWNSCQRRMAIINLHPGYSSRPRQIWFIVMQILKYLPPNENYRSPRTKFLGNVTFGALVHQDNSRNPKVPAHIHNAKFVSYGKCVFE